MNPTKRRTAALSDSVAQGEPARKKSTPTEVQRDRLMERISRLEEDRRVAAHDAREAIKRNAEADLKARLDKSDARIRDRFMARIAPLEAMLSALTPAATGKDA